MQPITIKPAHTWHYAKMHLCVERCSDLASLSESRSWPGCITNTSGYDFRKGQSWGKRMRHEETRRQLAILESVRSDLLDNKKDQLHVADLPALFEIVHILRGYKNVRHLQNEVGINGLLLNKFLKFRGSISRKD